ncbi:MAG: hypothetical protein H0X19_00830 [Rubrobacter sp.]|nr:hypothetical protein [Rubrobacter sp.]
MGEPKYEWEDRDAWRYYDPLREHPGLFLEFARLAEKDRSNPNEIALDWARQYGLLGSSRGYYRDRRTFERYAAAQHEYVDQFFEEVDRAAAVLAFYEASLNRDEDAIMPLLGRFDTWPVDLFVEYFDSDLEDLYGGRLGFALYLVTYEVVRMVDAFAYPKLTLQPGSSLPSSLSSGYGFFNLLGAMYLQMYWLVAAGEKHVARCRHCGKLVGLTVRASGSEGEGKRRKPRQDKRFCNNACRQRYHYQNNTKPKREEKRSRQV